MGKQHTLQPKICTQQPHDTCQCIFLPTQAVFYTLLHLSCVFVHVGAHMPWCPCRGQRKTFETFLSSSTILFTVRLGSRRLSQLAHLIGFSPAGKTCIQYVLGKMTAYSYYKPKFSPVMFCHSFLFHTSGELLLGL